MQKLAEERMKKLEFMKGLKGPYSAKIVDENTGIWRKDRPVINNDLCIKCNICATYCPIGAIEKQEIMVIDYDYCKGCGICEEVCPKKAIDLVNEKNFEEGGN